MRRLPLLAPLLLVAAQATARQAAPFPWTHGQLETGPSVAQPLLFRWSDGLPGGPPGRGSLAPERATLRRLWPAGPQPVTQAVMSAELRPGVPEVMGRSWALPFSLQLNGVPATPAVLQLTLASGQTRTLAVHPGVQVSTPFRPGQAFLCLGLNVPYTRHGAVLEAPQLAGRVLTLRRAEPGRAVFSAEGLGEVVRLGNTGRPGDVSGGFPDLAPIIEDPGLAALKRKYEGKQVWGYGGLETTCTPDGVLSVDRGTGLGAAVRVRRVLRLGRPLDLNVQGSPAMEGEPGADAIVLTPVVMLLDAAPFKVVGDYGGIYPGTALGSILSPAQVRERQQLAEMDRQAHRPDLCGLNVPYPLMDTWAAERVFSLTPPGKNVPRTPPRTATGLSRWQVAWLRGFPSRLFGRRDELLRLPVWRYRNVPADITVAFDAAGRVSREDIPRLP